MRCGIPLLCALLLGASACDEVQDEPLPSPGSSTDQQDDSAPILSAQDALCVSYPSTLSCPTLPASPQGVDGVAIDDAYQVPDCPEGTRPVFGGSTCVRLGSACPEGVWPEELPEGELRFVTPGGTGDGRSPSSPAGNLTEVIESAPSGATIVLSQGTFPSALRLSKSLTLFGTCPLGTTLEWDGSYGEPAVLITGEGGNLYNLGITGDAVGVKVEATSQEVQLESLYIVDTALDGVWADTQSQVALKDVAVVGTKPNAAGQYGVGLFARNGAQVTLDGVYLQGNVATGLTAMSGARVQGRDVAIVETPYSDEGTYGIRAYLGADIHLTQILVSASGALALALSGQDTKVTLADVLLEGAFENVETPHAGFIQASGATLDLERALIRGFTGFAGLIQGDESEGPCSSTLRDVRFSDTRVDENDTGAGLAIETLVDARLERVWLDAQPGVPLFVVGDTEISGSDVVVTHARLAAATPIETGIGVGRGANVDLSRVAIHKARTFAAMAHGFSESGRPTTLRLQDAWVADTYSDLKGQFGRGFHVLDGASLDMASAVIERNRDIGIAILHEGTNVSLRDVSIRETQVARCEEDPLLDCPLAGGGFGDGIVVLGGGHLEMERFEIIDNARTGLYLYDTTDSVFELGLFPITGAPTLTAYQGDIVGNEYGINFRQGQITPADFAGKEVACYDNPATIDGCFSEVELEVPSSEEALAGLDGVSR